jgi:folylpolyglutamate synthase
MTSDGDDESFATAVAALYSPLHQSVSPESIARAAARRVGTVTDMRVYLQRAELHTIARNSDSVTSSNVPRTRPRIIHVTGTKGKGSVCCLCECILRERFGLRTGLFTSPHLVDVRERIRVQGKPVSPDVFAHTYWRIRSRLEAFRNTNIGGDGVGDDEDLPTLPGYFRMLTLMALYVFYHYEPRIDVIVLEVGMGGRYDATNILDLDLYDVRCGITQLDYDHVRVLGNTLEEIAWEKGGIFKVHKADNANVTLKPHSAEAVTKQEIIDFSLAATDHASEDDSGNTRGHMFFALDTNSPSALQVLHDCARIEGRGVTLQLVGVAEAESSQHQKRSGYTMLPDSCLIGLPGSHQRLNAQLAITLCESLSLSGKDKARSIQDRGVDVMFDALSRASWPGRCQTVEVPEQSMTLRLDGAHTVQSIKVGYNWFKLQQKDCNNSRNILIFNCSHERDPVELLDLLDCEMFTAAFFCRADSERPSAVVKASAQDLLQRSGRVVRQDLLPNTQATWQETLESLWNHRCEQTPHRSEISMTTASNLSVSQALKQIRKSQYAGEHSEVLVTGSLYLVGSVLNAVKWSEREADGKLQDLITCCL